MSWNPIAWLFSGAMVPLFKSIIKHRLGSPEVNQTVVIYGYLTVCGVIFNCAVLVVFVSEVLL